MSGKESCSGLQYLGDKGKWDALGLGDIWMGNWAMDYDESV